ncbi:flavin-containing monooxygenase [Streptomyces zagrosensis]|uniref:Cation diffusion facilitator CzcD-associated flavoprotein CzcO n=1 Tax=Streptomyces zagrosensis TaxID=1042984 RepID=A0A7W9UX50_9ACTN|nr:NAD(P)/FAD-dependent oxidoreductase [Streptomyces zagrosensis]MBB5933916.1 cation diffusion facilitator CzcD-associated flavoprotein CzcO [Streptomyces zagrosensis]
MPTPSSGTAATPVVVIGAGPSGLAVAARLRRADVPVVVYERAGRIGAHWRGHYDHLSLHTTRALSRLPGLPIPRAAGRWVGRDDWARYLERYADHHRIDVRTHTVVERIELAASLADADQTPYPAALWRVRTGSGVLRARAVVVATGRNHTPRLPQWPGRTTFTGTLLHSRDYRSPAPYQGREVLVVGAGNSGTEIAVALAEAGAARVWLSLRTPPHMVPAATNRWQLAGLWAHRLPPAVGDRLNGLMRRLLLPDLTGHGLPEPTMGLYTRSARDEMSPVHDRGIVEAIRAGRVRPRAAVVGIDGARVVLADDSDVQPEAIIAATGYHCGLGSLLDALPVLRANGEPVVRGAETSPCAPHLYFAGYGNPLSGALHQAGIDARNIGRALRRASRPRAATA